VARILIAPDSFKGSATSVQVAHAIKQGWISLRAHDLVTCTPFADGGEGTLDCIESVSTDSERISISVQGATGREHQSSWLLVDGDTAVIEMATLCGITTVEKLDPLGAHSFGLGQAIADALEDQRVKEILVTVGGSASTDGGTGALAALGFRFTDADGLPVALGGGNLQKIAAIAAPGDLQIPTRGIKVLVDVQSPLLGETGAAQIFGPQKGASAHDIQLLDEGLAHLLHLVGGRDTSGFGAAGGVSFGLSALLGATIVSGVETLATLIGLDEKIASAEYVITGEGSFDSQSFGGKVVGHILDRAQVLGAEAAVICGVNKSGSDVTAIALVDLAPTVDQAINESKKWLIEAGSKLAAAFHH
jgi:glycerate 2-kinase